MKKNLVLYNVLFPIWLLWLFPTTWIVVLPLNLFWDYLILRLSMRHFPEASEREVAKKVLWKSWLLGFLADFLGTGLMFSVTLFFSDSNTPMGNWWYHNLEQPVSYNPFASIWAFLFVTFCVVITALLLYWFNLKIALRNASLTLGQKKHVALRMAIFTAPYLFYLPSMILYSF